MTDCTFCDTLFDMTTAHDPAALIPVAELRAQLGEIVNRVAYGGERILVTRNGKPAVALVSAADLTRLDAIDAAEDVADFDEAVANDDGYRVSSAALRAAHGI